MVVYAPLTGTSQTGYGSRREELCVAASTAVGAGGLGDGVGGDEFVAAGEGHADGTGVLDAAVGAAGIGGFAQLAFPHPELDHAFEGARLDIELAGHLRQREGFARFKGIEDVA